MCEELARVGTCRACGCEGCFRRENWEDSIDFTVEYPSYEDTEDDFYEVAYPE